VLVLTMYTSASYSAENRLKDKVYVLVGTNLPG